MSDTYQPPAIIDEGDLQGWILLPPSRPDQEQRWGHRRGDEYTAAVVYEDDPDQLLRCPQCREPVPARLQPRG
jgi:hypothetical protein